jgi:hypothetical protein
MKRIVLALAVASAISGRMAAGQEGDPLAAADPGWVESWRGEIDRNYEFLSSAYNLTPEMQDQLRAELDARLAQQLAYDNGPMAELQKEAQAIMQARGGELTDADINEEFNKKALELTANMPLNEDRIGEWLEARLPMDQAVVAEGHQRWLELRDRHWKSQFVVDSDAQYAAGRKAVLAEQKVAAEAVLTTEGEPLPYGDKGERLAPLVIQDRNRQAWVEVPRPGVKLPPPGVEPTANRQEMELKAIEQSYADALQQARALEMERPTIIQPEPGAPPAAVPQKVHAAPAMPPEQGQPPVAHPVKGGEAAAPLPTAPPLDEWDRHVAGVAGKYGFDEGQRTIARSILRDLKKRANQYRLTRATDIARAELMTDARARIHALAILNRPIDAMFEELKQRLENLPTAAQRQRAGKAR